jgi:hypothetical protein
VQTEDEFGQIISAQDEALAPQEWLEQAAQTLSKHETAAHADSEILESHVCIQYRGYILLPLLVQVGHDWK